MSILIQETPTKWILNPHSIKVSRCMLDYTVTLDMTNAAVGPQATLTIECDFVLTMNGMAQVIEAVNFKSMGQASVLINKEWLQGQIFKNGDLELKFSDNIILTVKSHELYEAWNFNLQNGTMFVSIPGGDIAYWSGEA